VIKDLIRILIKWINILIKLIHNLYWMICYKKVLKIWLIKLLEMELVVKLMDLLIKYFDFIYLIF